MFSKTNNLPFLHYPKHWHSSVHFKSDVKHLHRPVHPFLHPMLTSFLHTFEVCDKSVHNRIISFYIFCQPHWQVLRPFKSLRKDCRHIEDWRTDLRTCCLSAPLVGGMFSITLLSLENRFHLAFLIFLPQRTQVVRIHHHWFRSVLQ